MDKLGVCQNLLPKIEKPTFNMPDKIIVDSSVIVKWLHQKDEKWLDRAGQVAKDAYKGNVKLITPELAKFEVMNALIYGKRLTLEEVKLPIKILFTIPINFVTFNQKYSFETYKIAKETGITFYDASFIALAMENNATLVTDNPKHQGKVKEAKVMALKDYPM